MNISGLGRLFGWEQNRPLYLQPGKTDSNEKLLASLNKTDGKDRRAITADLESAGAPTTWTHLKGPASTTAVLGLALGVMNAGYVGLVKAREDNILFDRDNSWSRNVFCAGYAANKDLTLFDDVVSGIGKIKDVAQLLGGYMPTILSTTMNKTTQCAVSPNSAAATVWLERTWESMNESGDSNWNFTARTAILVSLACFCAYKYRQNVANQDGNIQLAADQYIKILDDVKNDLHQKNSRYYYYSNGMQCQVKLLAKNLKTNLPTAIAATNELKERFTEKQKTQITETGENMVKIVNDIRSKPHPAVPAEKPDYTWSEWMSDKVVDAAIGTVDTVGWGVDSVFKRIVG